MKKVTFLLATLLIGGMMLTGCKKETPTPTPDNPTGLVTTAVVYQVANTFEGITMSPCFKLNVTYTDANGQSVTENNVTLPWSKTVEAKTPFHAKMEGTYVYNEADLPDQVIFGALYGIGFMKNNELNISLTGNLSSSKKEAFINSVSANPNRLKFTCEKDF